jgi:alpha-tubulin suppressor-like RCC1 family protein
MLSCCLFRVFDIQLESEPNRVSTEGGTGGRGLAVNRIPGFPHLLKTSFCMVACGHSHTLALTVGGKVFAWG